MRVYARVYDCQDSTGHGTPPEHRTRSEHTTTGKREEHRQTKFAIGRRTTRQQRKKVKKNLEIRK